MNYCMFILGNGRRGYLERTVASWEANLVAQPKYKIIFDDSGNKEYVNWLKNKYENEYIVCPIADKSMGQIYALKFIFNYLKNLDAEYFLQLEEDWMLFRKLNIQEIIEVLETNQNIIQMRIPRTIWYADYHVLDINAGSLLKYHAELPNTITEIKHNHKNTWYEWRGDFYFWSHNPSVFNKSILNYEYSTDKSHEYVFGKNLFNINSNHVAGWWAENFYDAYITHIGIRNNNLLKDMPPLN